MILVLYVIGAIAVLIVLLLAMAMIEKEQKTIENADKEIANEETLEVLMDGFIITNNHFIKEHPLVGFGCESFASAIDVLKYCRDHSLYLAPRPITNPINIEPKFTDEESEEQNTIPGPEGARD